MSALPPVGSRQDAAGPPDGTDPARAERLLTLAVELTQILTTADLTEAALVAAIRAVCTSQGWSAGTYWRLDETDGVLRIQAGWPVDDARIRAARQQRPESTRESGVGLVEEVVRTGTPLYIPNLHDDPRVMGKILADETGWTGALLVPVRVQQQCIGAIEFNAAHLPQPDSRLLDLLQVLAAQIGNFFMRAVALDRLRESEERHASTIELAAIGISHVTTEGKFIHVNRVLCRMLGYTKDELLKLSVKAISHPDDVAVTDAEVDRLHAGAIESFKAEKRYLRKDGTAIWVRLTVAARRGADGQILHHISIVEDISERLQAEARIQYLATHDDMTGLYNRSMFNQILVRSIAQGHRYGRVFAVLFIDLDRFKVVNDRLGHEAGDSLLKTMAARLQTRVRASDVVARFGGDEFVALVETQDRESASVAARRYLEVLVAPVHLLGHECRVTASIGIAMFPDDGADSNSLIKRADMAQYEAKDNGKNTYRFYAGDVGSVAVEQMELEHHLRHALDRRELSMHYQAKLDLKTGGICGVEALLRWQSPALGMVSPTRFIPIAEETGLIVSIGRWALVTACEQAAAWGREGLPAVCMAVNLSRAQFRDPSLLDTIRQVLADTEMPPGLLELEITESMIMQDVDLAVEKLRAIRALGVRLAIDDFGTGYSSLSQLKLFPVNTLKIDRSFIRDIPGDAQDRAITEAIIAVGKSLGFVVVAEGVETATQQDYLRAQACDEMQGFYFSRPLEPEGFAELLRARPQAAALAWRRPTRRRPPARGQRLRITSGRR